MIVILEQHDLPKKNEKGFYVMPILSGNMSILERAHVVLVHEGGNKFTIHKCRNVVPGKDILSDIMYSVKKCII